MSTLDDEMWGGLVCDFAGLSEPEYTEKARAHHATLDSPPFSFTAFLARLDDEVKARRKRYGLR